MPSPFQVTFDAVDPARLAEFWMIALGYEIPSPPDGFDSWDEWATAMEIPEEGWNDARAIIDPRGEGPRIFIQKVPEAKTVKNRVHLDINKSGGPGTPLEERIGRVDAEVDRLVAAGATRGEPFQQRDEYWVVMQDPEGNEFCVH